MNIVACGCIYNERDFIEGWLANVSSWANEIVLVDGRYSLFKGEGLASTDGSLDVIAEWKEKKGVPPIHLIPARAWNTEAEKRTSYFNYYSELGMLNDSPKAKEKLLSDTLFVVLDLDERLEGRIKETLAAIDLPPVKWLPVFEVEVKGAGVYPRLIRWRKGLRYYKQHWLIVDDEMNELHEYARDKYACGVCRSIWIEHLKKSRDAERKKQIKDYYEIPEWRRT